jgi:hypothetical protein
MLFDRNVSSLTAASRSDSLVENLRTNEVGRPLTVGSNRPSFQISTAIQGVADSSTDTKFLLLRSLGAVFISRASSFPQHGVPHGIENRNYGPGPRQLTRVHWRSSWPGQLISRRRTPRVGRIAILSHHGLNRQPKTRAERAFHLSGVGAPAHASCWKEPISIFSQPEVMNNSGQAASHTARQQTPAFVQSDSFRPASLPTLQTSGKALPKATHKGATLTRFSENFLILIRLTSTKRF